MLANVDSEFGYDAITGGKIHTEHVRIRPLAAGDFVVLTSDGYPLLLETLAKTEEHLFRALAADPDCVDSLKSTKGLQKGYESFDDRSYISFIVP